MTTITAIVESVYVGSAAIDDLAKQSYRSLKLNLDGIVGDRHPSQSRQAWEHDKQPEGTAPRNERLWPAVSVEEYNPPCQDMGTKLAGLYADKAGQLIANTAFSQAAKFIRSLVGVAEVAGVLKAGDRVVFTPYQLRSWIERLSKKVLIE